MQSTTIKDRRKIKQPGLSLVRDLHKNWRLHLFVLPGIILTLIFAYIPMGGLIMAFQNYKPWLGITGSEWVGMDNFRTIFQFEESRQVIINTFIIAILKIGFGFGVPVVMALLLNEIRLMAIKKGIQTLVYLPHFLSWVTVAGIMLDILSVDGGIINRILNAFGMDTIFFFGDPEWFRAILIISDVWKEFGFGMIVYLAAITSVDPSYYEAAEIDGASRWKQTLHVTIPAMLPIIIVIGTLQLGNVLNAGFDQIFNLYNPLVYSTGDVIDTYVYRASLMSGDYSFGTAIGLFKSSISLVLILVSYRLAYRYGNYRIF